MLNEYLKEMYLASRGMKVSQDIYRLMQRVDREKYTDWNKEAFDELSKSCGDIRAGWKIDSHSSSDYWHQICIGDNKTYFSIAKIKVYVGCKGKEVKDLFIGAVKEIMEKGRDEFFAKVSTRVRDDTICFYVCKNEFLILENYLRLHEDRLFNGNPFIAHRGLLGISRDLIDIDSYNAQLAKSWEDLGIVKVGYSNDR